MATTDLLTKVLAPEGEGYYCIVGLRQDGTRPPIQSFHATLVEAEAQIDKLLKDKLNVYFACAKYKDPMEGRIQPNGDIIKAFWIDVDCGLGKPYADQAEGLSALKTFCAKVHLPLPTIVNSGRGIHAYWRLTNVIDRLQWKPVAERLKALCEEYDFHADPSRTADNASILRVPETLNFNCSDAVLECQGHVLLIQRKFAPGAGAWALPGGFRNQRETFLDCAIRELMEETNVRIPEKVLRGSIVKTELFDSPNRSFGIPRNTMAVYMRISPNPDYTLPRANGSDDAALCKWVPLTDALNNIEMYDDHKDIISKVTGVNPMPAFAKL